MKVLIYSTCSYFDPSFGVLLECALQHQAKGDEVAFAYCSGACKTCSANLSGSGILCRFCQSYRRRLLNRFGKGLRRLPQSGRMEQPHPFSFSNIQDLKKTTYRGCSIGYGVLSTYISATRDCVPDLRNPKMHRFMEQMLDEAAYVADLGWRLIEEEKPDMIVIFNGRLMENRPFREIAGIKGIPFKSMEVIGNFRAEDEEFRVISYPDGLPHDVSTNTVLLHKLWEISPETEEVKRRKGEDFYIRRRNGKIAGDRVYISEQKQGLLPEHWDKTRKNIVIFNSSEDEFAAIGPEFDQFALFPSQEKGIHYILQQLNSPEYHFYLRIHPNLKNVHYEYRENLLELPKKYPNLTVIDAQSPISTYALMDAADQVIVFGSTAGAEAAYWRKPVILLAASFYRNLDITYNPETPAELIEMIQGNLPPKPNFNAIKFGYYLLNRKYLSEQSKFIDLRIQRIKIWRYTFFATAYAKLFGSITLQKFLRIFLVYSFRKFGIFKLPVSFFDDHTMRKQ